MIGTLAVLLLLGGWALLAYWLHRARRRAGGWVQGPVRSDDRIPILCDDPREFRQAFIDRVRANHDALAPEVPTEPIVRQEAAQPVVLGHSVRAKVRPPVDSGGQRPRKRIRRPRRGRHRIENRKGIDMLECPNCGGDVLMVQLAGSPTEIALDSTPDPARGQVIVLGNTCRFVTTPEDWAKVHEYHLPVYRRHNTHCSGFWWGRVHPNHNPDIGTETR